MSNESRKERVVKAWEAAWDHGDVDALDGLMSPGYVRRSTSGHQDQSREEFKAAITSARSAFPDLTTTIEEIVADGDRVAIRWHSDGRHEGSFLGVPATHRQMTVSGATFARFEGDLVVEEYVTWDPRALLAALGIIHVGEDR
jgi:steroid delta-isomerase-like uncharacterized protein